MESVRNWDYVLTALDVNVHEKVIDEIIDIVAR